MEGSDDGVEGSGSDVGGCELVILLSDNVHQLRQTAMILASISIG